MTAGSCTLCWAGDGKISCAVVTARAFRCHAVLLQQTAVASAQLPQSVCAVFRAVSSGIKVAQMAAWLITQAVKAPG